MQEYQEVLVVRTLTKLRSTDQCDDPESVHYVPDSELDESIDKKGILLGHVLSWEEYKNPFGRFNYKGPLISVEYFDDMAGFLILSDFDSFNQKMINFVNNSNIALKLQVES